MKHHTFIDFDFDKYPIQLKTDSEIGSGEAIDIVFYTSTETSVKNWENVGYIWIIFRDPMEYNVYPCTNGWDTFDVAIPEETNKIWEIVKTTSDLRIICNNVEVAKIEFDQVRQH